MVGEAISKRVNKAPGRISLSVFFGLSSQRAQDVQLVQRRSILHFALIEAASAD